MNKILDFKKIVSIGFFAAFLAVFLSAGTAQASFWDWFNLNKANNTSQQQQAAAIANADTTSSSSSSSTSANHTASTGSAENITSTSATLNGTVNPNGEETSYIFAYRKNSDSSSLTKYAPSNTYTSVGSGSSDFSVSADISGLSSGTKYVYRLYAYSSTTSRTTKKFVNGDLKSFITTTSGSSSSSSVSSGAISSSSSVQQYTLKVKIAGAGHIRGYLGSAGEKIIDCKKKIDGNKIVLDEGNKTCTAKINSRESVRLSITNSSTQYEFATWADNCRGANGDCTLTMNNNKTVSATFNKKSGSGKETATVSVRKTGKGVGKIISVYSGGENSGKEDGRINCGNNCSENYEKICEGTSEGRGCSLAYFKAVAEKGSTFSGWGGDCLTFKNEKDQCYVILDGAKTINANFNEGSGNTEGKYFDLTVTVSEGGKVESTDNKISCDSVSSPCKHSYGKNGTVTLKVTPNSGYALGDYSGCSKSGNVQNGVLTCKVKMTQNRNVKINFKASGTTSSSSSSKTSSSSASAKHTATTNSATNVTSTSATLNGTVNPNGEETSYIFAYRKNSDSSSLTKYAPSNTYTSVGSGSSDFSVSADISGLSSGTKYVYRLYAYSSTTSRTTKKFVNGDLKSFTTSRSSSNSSSSSSSSSQTTASTYKLKVTVQGNGKIEDNYSKISCGSNMACEATYSKGQMIRIKTDDIDSTGASYNTKVESWNGGGCSGTSNSCDITMDGDKEVTIKFVSK